MGATLFRHRLALLVLLFGAGAGLAFLFARGRDGAADVVDATIAILQTGEALLGRERAFLVTGPLCLVAFFLRASGEARLGSAVYGQDPSPRVITSGPFRFTRHPLYIGAWLFFAALFFPYLPPIVLGALALVLALAMRAIAVFEEQAMHEKLGAAWARYAAAVPRFIGAFKPVDDDGVVTTARAWALATLGNLGLLSFGLYRIAIGAGIMFKGIHALALLFAFAWIAVVIGRRFLRR